MRKPVLFRYYFLVSLILISVSCSEKGCPGGMCLPNQHSSYFKRTSKRGLHSKYNHAKHKNFGKKNNKLYRKTNYKTKVRKNYSIEYNNNWSNFNRGTSNYTNIEQSPFRNKRTKTPSQRKLQKSKAYKEPNRTRKHNEGLWSKEVQNWQTRTEKPKKKKDTTKKEGKGVKKIK